MTTADPGFVQAVIDDLAPLGPIDRRPYFGGIALVREGRQFAFVMGATLYLSTGERSRDAKRRSGAQPFEYQTRTGSRTVEAYYDTPRHVVDDQPLLLEWAAEAVASGRADGH